jgi:hypothetical protein
LGVSAVEAAPFGDGGVVCGVVAGFDVPDEPVVFGVTVPGLSFFIIESDLCMESFFFMPSADAAPDTPAISPAAKTALKNFEFMLRLPVSCRTSTQVECNGSSEKAVPSISRRIMEPAKALSVMPGLVSGTHAFLQHQDVDGRNKSGHDE